VFQAPLRADYQAFLYGYEGEVRVGADRRNLPSRAAGLLSEGAAVRVEAGEAGARFLLLAGKPLGEPVVQYGPFVMNTREEIEQTLADYRAGKLIASA
jgi:redox-sensitive bicupin YhaK (pirin superfamily)